MYDLVDRDEGLKEAKRWARASSGGYEKGSRGFGK